jgi:hypothetical protein
MEVDSLHVRAGKDAIDERRFSEIASRKVGIREDAPLEDTPGEVGTGEVEIGAITSGDDVATPYHALELGTVHGLLNG